MTDQEVFDKTVRHLWQQGSPATEKGICYYRAPNGAKCAVGIHISDSVYSSAMETHGLTKLLDVRDSVYKPQLEYLRPHLPLLCQLQNEHDSWESDKELAKTLREIASSFSLNAASVDETFGSAA